MNSQHNVYLLATSQALCNQHLVLAISRLRTYVAVVAVRRAWPDTTRCQLCLPRIVPVRTPTTLTCNYIDRQIDRYISFDNSISRQIDNDMHIHGSMVDPRGGKRIESYICMLPLAYIINFCYNCKYSTSNYYSLGPSVPQYKGFQVNVTYHSPNLLYQVCQYYGTERIVISMLSTNENPFT